MEVLQTVVLQCPHCWEEIEILVDCSVSQHSIVEDCTVCCGPMAIDIWMEEDEKLRAEARRENG